MTIDEQISLLESMAEEDIKLMSSKDRLTYYQNLKEFQRPKMSRAGFVSSDTLPAKIQIELVK